MFPHFESAAKSKWLLHINISFRGDMKLEEFLTIIKSASATMQHRCFVGNTHKSCPFVSAHKGRKSKMRSTHKDFRRFVLGISAPCRHRTVPTPMLARTKCARNSEKWQVDRDHKKSLVKSVFHSRRATNSSSHIIDQNVTLV